VQLLARALGGLDQAPRFLQHRRSVQPALVAQNLPPSRHTRLGFGHPALGVLASRGKQIGARVIGGQFAL
jgi:hypothetical protein